MICPSIRSATPCGDLDRLIAACAAHGPSVGIYAERILDDRLPWTRMRTVYRLLGLVRRHGAERVEAACSHSGSRCRLGHQDRGHAGAGHRVQPPRHCPGSSRDSTDLVLP